MRGHRDAVNLSTARKFGDHVLDGAHREGRLTLAEEERPLRFGFDRGLPIVLQRPAGSGVEGQLAKF